MRKWFEIPQLKNAYCLVVTWILQQEFTQIGCLNQNNLKENILQQVIFIGVSNLFWYSTLINNFITLSFKILNFIKTLCHVTKASENWCENRSTWATRNPNFFSLAWSLCHMWKMVLSDDIDHLFKQMNCLVDGLL